jgi:hypothetical protein
MEGSVPSAVSFFGSEARRSPLAAVCALVAARWPTICNLQLVFLGDSLSEGSSLKIGIRS